MSLSTRSVEVHISAQDAETSMQITFPPDVDIAVKVMVVSDRASDVAVDRPVVADVPEIPECRTHSPVSDNSATSNSSDFCGPRMGWEFSPSSDADFAIRRLWASSEVGCWSKIAHLIA